MVIDQPGIEPADKPVLATLTHFFSSGCWTVEDVRLSQYGRPSKWFCVGADSYHAHFDAKNEKTAGIVRSLLTDFTEAVNDKGGTSFDWCTYEGLVKGQRSSEIAKYGGVYVNDYPLFHTRKEGLEILKSIAEFWQAVPIDAADPEVIEKTAEIKIENPHRQTSESRVLSETLLPDSIRKKMPRP